MTNPWKNKRVGVLMGGLSSERAVSLNTGAGVFEALRGRGYDVVAIDWRDGADLGDALAEVDVVWNGLHGTYGEDGAVQGLCACLGIACTGSNILASAIAMDKVASKQIFEHEGVSTPPWAIVDPDDDTLAAWELPLVIKPAREGSSVGVSVVTERAQIAGALATARALHGPTLVERYIPGTELHTSILDGEVLGSVDVVPASGWYDYQAKYERDDTQYIIPPRLDTAVLEAAEATALRAHRALGCGAYSRVDSRVDSDGRAYVLEVNTLPGMTSHSLLPKVAAYAGIDYATLCERILASAALPLS